MELTEPSLNGTIGSKVEMSANSVYTFYSLKDKVVLFAQERNATTKCLGFTLCSQCGHIYRGLLRDNIIGCSMKTTNVLLYTPRC